MIISIVIDLDVFFFSLSSGADGVSHRVCGGPLQAALHQVRLPQGRVHRGVLRGMAILKIFKYYLHLNDLYSHFFNLCRTPRSRRTRGCGRSCRRTRETSSPQTRSAWNESQRCARLNKKSNQLCYFGIFPLGSD